MITKRRYVVSTPYNTVINIFLAKVTDYHLSLMESTDREDYVNKLLKNAIVNFQNICKVDLRDRDDILKQFNQELDDEIIDILSELMITSWLKQYLNNVSNLENVLNTKDFNQYSSSTLLKEIRTTYNESKSNCKQLMIEYSYSHNDISELHQ
jgi:hypothetical protein